MPESADDKRQQAQERARQHLEARAARHHDLIQAIDTAEIPELAECWYQLVEGLCAPTGNPMDDDLHALWRASLRLAAAATELQTPHKALPALRGALIGLPGNVDDARGIFAHDPSIVRLRTQAAKEIGQLLVAYDLRVSQQGRRRLTVASTEGASASVSSVADSDHTMLPSQGQPSGNERPQAADRAYTLQLLSEILVPDLPADLREALLDSFVSCGAISERNGEFDVRKRPGALCEYPPDAHRHLRRAIGELLADPRAHVLKSLMLAERVGGSGSQSQGLGRSAQVMERPTTWSPKDEEALQRLSWDREKLVDGLHGLGFLMARELVEHVIARQTAARSPRKPPAGQQARARASASLALPSLPVASTTAPVSPPPAGKTGPATECMVDKTSPDTALVCEGGTRIRISGPRRVWLLLSVVNAGRSLTWEELVESDMRNAADLLDRRMTSRASGSERPRNSLGHHRRGTRTPKMATSARTLQNLGSRIRKDLGKLGYHWNQDGNGVVWSPDCQ